MGSLTQFSCKKLVFFLGSFSFSVSRIFLTLFSFICTYLFRLQSNGGYLKNGFVHSEVVSEEINQKASEVTLSSSEPEMQPEATAEELKDFSESESEKEEEEEKSEFNFQFRFPTFEEFCRSKKEKSDPVDSELVSSTSISRYQFMSGKSYSAFVEEPEVLHCDVKQITADSSCTVSIAEDTVVPHQIQSESDRIAKQVPAEPVEVLNEIAEPVKEDDNIQHDQNSLKYANSTVSPSTDSCSEGFLSDADFGSEFDFDGLTDINGEKGECSSLADLEENEESEDFDEEDSDILEELWKLEEDQENDTADGFKSRFLYEEDFHENDDEFNSKDDSSNDSGKVESKDSSESEDTNELETLWEHQELIEQLKMELRKVRATGLPTILEESESQKITEDLKPWRIDEKFQHEECMDELHKFYKSYRERMRKFDIFNYQKMYAIGFFQLKDPLQSTSSQKSSGPALKSLLSQNFWHLKHRISDSDPMVKFMKELQSDLEVIYVGQMCLSWEFLHWQYGKALDLWDSDPRLIHQYNEVAGEFQQFQVLAQRFIEDEPFQGPRPRVHYYTKSRCVNKYLLQVPVIREDKKDRRRGRKDEKPQHAITSDMLVEMMEESIRILWRFIRADKDCCSAVVKSRKAKTTQLQNPCDLDLLTEVTKILEKKERKLKDLVRSGNCILKRFGKCREDYSDQVLYFFSQVDMKLVARVLNMSKITRDQLLWCHSKLSKINLDHRKIQVEPTFLLFPC